MQPQFSPKTVPLPFVCPALAVDDSYGNLLIEKPRHLLALETFLGVGFAASEFGFPDAATVVKGIGSPAGKGLQHGVEGGMVFENFLGEKLVIECGQIGCGG